MAKEETQSLAGKRVLVSGGTTGIGRATVERLLREGAKVATFARTEEDVQELLQAHPEVLAFTADLTDQEGVRSAVDRAVSEFGGLDILVNNAGIAGESVTEMDYEGWKSVIEVNLMGPMLLTQIAAEKLGKGAHIVTVGSLSAKSRSEGSDVYVASKSGIRGFVDSVSKVLAKKGILTTLIEPGLAEADMTTEDKTDEEVQKLKDEDKMMEADDVARAILFAASQPPHMLIAEIQIRPRAQAI